MEPLTAGEKKSRWVGAAILLALFTATFLIDPIRPLGGAKFCGFLILTGLPCPTCGMTRSVCCLSRGMFGESLGFHLLGGLVYAGALVWGAVMIAELSAGRKFRWYRSRRKWPFVAGAVTLVLTVWVFRVWGIVQDNPAAWHDSVLYQALSVTR